MFVAFLGFPYSTRATMPHAFPDFLALQKKIQAILDVKLPKKTSIWELQKRISVPLTSGDADFPGPPSGDEGPLVICCI